MGASQSIITRLTSREYNEYKFKKLKGKSFPEIPAIISYPKIDDSQNFYIDRAFNISQYLDNYINNEISKSSQKYNLNILYYDEKLIKLDENKDICTFFEMNLNGTFYGCHYFELFEKVCEKIKRNKTEFILISSGISAEKIFDFCLDMKEMREYYIYCSEKEKYFNLMGKYTKLKGIYDKFSDLKENLKNIAEIKNKNLSSSNLIYFEDYI